MRILASEFESQNKRIVSEKRDWTTERRERNGTSKSLVTEKTKNAKE